MSSQEERLKILRMIQEGKLSAEEGFQLMEALESTPNQPEVPPVPISNQGKAIPNPPIPEPIPPISRGQARWLHVRVTDTNTGKVRVNVRLPLTVVTAGMKMGARFSPEVEGLDMSLLMNVIRSGETGQIVDVVDEEDGEHVEVFVE